MQRSRFQGFAILVLLAAGAAGAESQTFANPMVGDRRVDVCHYWGRDCGKPAADAWCRSQGFASAASFQIQNDVGRSVVLGDKRPCDDRSCDAFSAVTCERAGVAATSARAQTAGGAVQGSRAVIAGAAAGQAGGSQGGLAASAATPGGAPVMGSDTNARITQLEDDAREFYVQIAALRDQQRQLADQQRQLADSVEFLRNNAVRPMCSQDATQAVHPVTGQKESCKPYLCNEVEGICRKQCSLTSECALEHVCDRPYCKHKSEFQ